MSVGEPRVTDIARVAVLSDHVAYCELLAEAVGSNDDVRVVARGDNPATLGDDDSFEIDIVLLDADSTTFDVVASIPQMLGRWPHARIIAMTRDDHPAMSVRLTRAGCAGLLTRTSTVDDIVQAIRMDGRGLVLVSRSALTAVRDRLAADPTNEGPGFRAATPREIEVLDRLLAGESTKDIATSLHLSVHTCRAHMRSLMQKFNARSQLELVARATAERRYR